MIKSVQARIAKNGLKHAKPVSAGFKTRHRKSASPNINKGKNQHPNQIHKVPIKDRQIKSSRFARTRLVQGQQANRQVEKPNDDVKPVESSG